MFRLRVRQLIALLALLSQVATTAFAHMPMEMTEGSTRVMSQAMAGDATAPGPHCHGDESALPAHALPQTTAQHAPAFSPAFEKRALEAGALARAVSEPTVRRTHAAESTTTDSALHAIATHAHSQPAQSQHDPNAPCKHGAACKCPCAHFPALSVSLTLAPRVPHSPIAVIDYEQASSARPTPLFRPPI